MSLKLSNTSNEKKQMKHISIRIDEIKILEAKELAEEKGIPYQTLMRSWIYEGLKKEQIAS